MERKEGTWLAVFLKFHFHPNVDGVTLPSSGEVKTFVQGSNNISLYLQCVDL